MSVKMSVEDRLVKSRVQLLMHYPFFGTLALHLKLKERSDIPTAATDGNHYFYNPKFIEQLDDAEINFLTAHETLHPALGHLWRRGSRDPVIWNHAADYCINGMIKESDPTGKDFKIIKGALIDDRFKGMFTEEIYDILIQDEEYVKKAHAMATMGNAGTIDSHDEWDKPNSGQDDGDGSGKGDGYSTGGEEDWKGRVVQASQVAEGKGRGTIPGAIKRMVKDLVAPQKNWRELLAEFVQQEINDYGWTPPNTHHIWRDIYLPDFTEQVDIIKDLVFAIDTSGSIGYKEIRTFLSEVVGCMNQFGGKVRGWILYFDADIQGVYELEDAEKSIPSGGGGTDFKPIFDWIEDNVEDCAGCVILTDLCAPFPKAPNYPVLWVSTEKRSEAPFGITTYIDVK